MNSRLLAVCCGGLVAMTAVQSAPAAELVDMLIHHWITHDGLPNNRVRGFIWL